METETVMMYVRLFPDLLETSLIDVEKRLEGLGKVLFSLGGQANEDDDDNNVGTDVAEIVSQKIDMRSPQSAALFLYLFRAQDGSHATLKLHRDGLLNIDVQLTRPIKLQLESSKEFEQRILDALGGIRVVSDSNVLSAGSLTYTLCVCVSLSVCLSLSVCVLYLWFTLH